MNGDLDGLRDALADKLSYTTIGGDCFWYANHLMPLIREAIAEVRESCAVLAETVANRTDDYSMQHHTTQYLNGYCDGADDAAAAIRSGQGRDENNEAGG